MRKAFTLVELLVSISIISILVAMLLPAVQTVREAARRTACSNKQRQIAIGLHSLESCQGRLPPTVGLENHNFLLHWQAATLPYLEQNAVYENVRSKLKTGGHVYYMAERTIRFPIFECPSNPDLGKIIRARKTGDFAFTDYCGVGGVALTGNKGVFFGDPIASKNRNHKGTSFREISDGLSNTLMFGERPPSDVGHGYGAWLGSQNFRAAATGALETTDTLAGDPDFQSICESRNLGFGPDERGGECSWTHHWSFHPAGANFARADSSIQFLSYKINKSVLAALATRSGGEPVNQ